MRDDERIDTLIEELKQLQVRETDLLGQLEDAYGRRDGASTPRRRTGRYQVGDRACVGPKQVEEGAQVCQGHFGPDAHPWCGRPW